MSDKEMIYEVTVHLEPAGEETALRYMREKHIAEVVQHPAFSGAQFFIVTDPAPGSFSFSTHYFVKDSEQLTRYLEGDSSALRKDFADTLGRYNPRVTRRVLMEMQSFTKSEQAI